MERKYHLEKVTGQRRPRNVAVRKWISWLLMLALFAPGILSGCGQAAQPPTPTVPPTTTRPEPTPSRPASSEPAYRPTGGWRSSTPEEQGVDFAQLLNMLRHIDEAGINVRTVTVTRNGYILLEAARQPFTLEMANEVKSVTKSVTGALIGIAIHEGYIKDVKQPVLSFFPEMTIANRDKEKEAITIEDLLTMQPGLDCADEKLGNGPLGSIEQSKDWVHFALDLPMASPPGRNLVYCTAAPHILSAILGKATGMSMQEYAQSRLFAPLGITASDISWGSDPQGITLGGYGLTIKPRDMAKLGLLYLYGGKWEGKQIVPQEWVAESSRAHATGQNDKDYGYLFWIYPSHFAAEGLGQQKIMVVKDHNMVVVVTAAIDFRKSPENDFAIEKLLQEYIIPAAKADGALPPNSAALGELQAEVAYLANPVGPVQPLSELARKVSGKTYILEDNAIGWKSLTLTFEEGSPQALARLEVAENASGDGPSTITQSVVIGMDNRYYVEKSSDGGFTARRGYWLDDEYPGPQAGPIMARH